MPTTTTPATKPANIDFKTQQNSMIFRDPSTLNDGEYSGDIAQLPVSATHTVGQASQFTAAGMTQAKADVAGTAVADAVALEAGTGSRLFLLRGFYRNDTLFSGLAVGDILYVSAATAGLITKTAPASTLQINIIGKIAYVSGTNIVAWIAPSSTCYKVA